MFLFWMSFSVIMIHTFFASVPVSGIRTAHFPWTSDWVLWNFTGSIWLPNMLIAAHIGHSKTLAQTSWPKPSPSLPMEQTRYLGSFFLWGREGNSLNYSMFFFKLPMSIMHEAKYQIPRDPDLRAAYRSSKFQRRSMLHGLSAMFFVWPFWKSALFTEAVWWGNCSPLFWRMWWLNVGGLVAHYHTLVW